VQQGEEAIEKLPEKPERRDKRKGWRQFTSYARGPLNIMLEA